MTSKDLPSVQMYPLGDAAVVVSFGDIISPGILGWVMAFADCLNKSPFPGFVELVPAYTTVTVFYTPWVVGEQGTESPYDRVIFFIQNRLANLKTAKTIAGNPVEIPVCYGGTFGPDLEFVARVNNLSPEEVIAIHAGGTYLVYMIGFAPGFPYLGGMAQKIAAPRKENPVADIPAGSVGIAGNQTGIYPIRTPGGWQLIGRTPLALFRPNQEPPALLKAGDQVKFIPISLAEFDKMMERQNES
jgi:inhibitor of KinA